MALARQTENEPKLYATILDKLSVESLDEVKRHPGYPEFYPNKEPIQLWLAITELVPTQSKLQGLVKKAARDEHHATTQGAYESIIKYR
jgi:trans-aconitate methyltransferase